MAVAIRKPRRTASPRPVRVLPPPMLIPASPETTDIAATEASRMLTRQTSAQWHRPPVTGEYTRFLGEIMPFQDARGRACANELHLADFMLAQDYS